MSKPKPPKLHGGKDRRLSVRSQRRAPMNVEAYARGLVMVAIQLAEEAAATSSADPAAAAPPRACFKIDRTVDRAKPVAAATPG